MSGYLHIATYVLLDAARLKERMGEAKELNSNHCSLYKGRSVEELADVGPYLFDITRSAEFVTWYLDNGWSDAWGLLLETPCSFEEVFQHFANFLLVKTEDGRELYFRFYDPRVLRIFLPTCNVRQLNEFFGPVKKFICEDEDPAYALVFSLQNNALKTERTDKEELLSQGA